MFNGKNKTKKYWELSEGQRTEKPLEDGMLCRYIRPLGEIVLTALD